MRLPSHIIEQRLAGLREVIAANGTIAQASTLLNVERNNIREWMKRRGIALPPSWHPRPTRRSGPRLPDGQPFLSDKTADPAALTEGEREAAERFGIRFERAAWLLQCEYSGTAYGLRITRTTSHR